MKLKKLAMLLMSLMLVPMSITAESEPTYSISEHAGVLAGYWALETPGPDVSEIADSLDFEIVFHDLSACGGFDRVDLLFLSTQSEGYGGGSGSSRNALFTYLGLAYDGDWTYAHPPVWFDPDTESLNLGDISIGLDLDPEVFKADFTVSGDQFPTDLTSASFAGSFSSGSIQNDEAPCPTSL